MTGREWKPGDVAMTAQNTVALCGNSGRFVDQGGAPWSDDRFPGNLRPLVVIDPESDDVERLARLVKVAYWGEETTPVSQGLRDAMRAALREFADPEPPRPEEPTGLGAVVEDAGGEKWIRWEIVGRHPLPWTVPGAVKPNRSYDQIDVARVLHEGWSE